VEDILERVGQSPIGPTELLSIVESVPYGTRRKAEDEGFVKLYRGYSASADYNWVCLFELMLIKITTTIQNNLFHQYEASVQNHEAFIGACQLVNDVPLREQLERRDKVCRNFMNATSI